MVWFPSPEITRAAETSKEFLEWAVLNRFTDFEEAWAACVDVNAMFKLLLTLNPQSKNLHWVAFRAASRTVQAEKMDLDEQLLDHLAKKLAALEAGSDKYDGEEAIARAIALNRIMFNDDAPRSKSQANMAVGWACCKSPSSCRMTLDCALRSERFRLGISDGSHVATEPSYQVKDIHELFPLPLTMSKVKYPSRYERKWVI